MAYEDFLKNESEKSPENQGSKETNGQFISEQQTSEAVEIANRDSLEEDEEEIEDEQINDSVNRKVSTFDQQNK